MINSIRNRSYVLDLMVALLLITTIYFLVGQRNLSQELATVADQNHSLNVQNLELLQRVKSCTDPEGSCYQSNNARTGEAVGQINKVTIAAALCAKKTANPTEADMNKCVADMLKVH